MKRLITFFTFFCLCASIIAAADTRFSGVVRNTSGQPIGGLTIHFYQPNGATFLHRSVVSAADGTWSIDLPQGPWRAAPLNDDVVRRGYFCRPGIAWCLGDGALCEDDWPALWGDGPIEWNFIADPINLVLRLVPTRPDLAVKMPRTPSAGVEVRFETTTEPMTLIRQWRIEKSFDLFIWQPQRTVALSGTSPVMIPDPDSASAPVCYYRAVQVEDIIPASKPAGK